MSNELMINESGVIARVELDTQIATAKAYPRKVEQCVAEAEAMIKLDQETAESCFYCLVRNGKEGKTEIKGASIRLAEIVASAWGHLHIAARTISNDGSFITSEGVCWDLEKNVRISQEVKRSIKTKNGQTYSQDMQGVTSAAAQSLALRNAILRVIPRALINKLYNVAVQHAIGDVKTINAKIKSIANRLEKTGIPKQRILDFYGKKSFDDFDQTHLEQMLGIGNAITEKMITIDEAFSLSENEKSENSKENLARILANKKKSETETVPDNEKKLQYEKLKYRLLNAKSKDDLDIAADLIMECDPMFHAELRAIYAEKSNR